MWLRVENIQGTKKKTNENKEGKEEEKARVRVEAAVRIQRKGIIE